MFIYPIYNHNWRNISTIYITRLASNEIFSPSNKIHREVGRAKDCTSLLTETQRFRKCLQGSKKLTKTHVVN